MPKFISPRAITEKRGIYEFKKTVYLEKAEKVRIKVFASSRYILYINGSYICEGPCRSSGEVRYMDTIVSEAFRAGENEIRAEVLHVQDPAEFSSVQKTLKPLFLFEAVAENLSVISDKSWTCSFRKNHRLIYFEWRFIPPNEEIDLRIPDSYLEVEESFDFTDSMYNHVGTAYLTPFQERPIPMIYPQEEEAFKIVKRGKNFVELDAGKYVTAKVKVCVPKNSSVKILYAECYETSEGKYIRDDFEGFLKGMYDSVRTDKEEYTFQTFWYRAFRFVKIESEEINKLLDSVRFMRCTYPLKEEGDFLCSDEALNEMQRISVNTLKCCMHEIFLDCPYYEQQQYSMDSAVEASVLMRLSSDTRLIRKCIQEFAASQRLDGLLLANYPSSFIQIIPGFSFFWIFLLKDYLEYTRDTAFVEQYMGTMDKILSYFDRIVKKNKFITRTDYWDFVDWVPEWDYGVPRVQKGEALTVYNLYYAYALRCGAFITSEAGRRELSEEYRRRFDELSDMLFDHCYDTEERFFKDGSETGTFSMHTAIWSILAELVTGKDAERMIEAIFTKPVSKSTFSMNYYLFRALEKAGKYEYAGILYEDWKRMLDMHCTTWCENPDQPRSECHGWSTAPLYEFSANILGVKVGLEDVIQIIPQVIENLTWAKGAVPTRFGLVNVQWEQKEQVFSVSVTAPAHVRKAVTLPNGEYFEFFGKEGIFSTELLDGSLA